MVWYGSTMLDTSARLLRLLALLQSRRYWPGAELAERLDVTTRTVRRDVERLRTLGYPVSSSAGVAGGYQLDRGAQLPPLLLDDDEALAMSVGLRGAVAAGIDGLDEACLRAMTKLEQVMPRRLRGRLGGLHGAIAQAMLSGPTVSAAVLGALAHASWADRIAYFGYTDLAGKATQRRVEPHGLVHLQGRWYLGAYDLERLAWRTFRVDRISGEVTEGLPFMRREVPDGTLTDLVTRSVSRARGRLVARVLIHAPLARVRAKVPALAAHIESAGEGCRLETGIGSMAHVALYLVLLDEEFEVESPPELQQMVEHLAGRFRRAADRHLAPSVPP